MQAPGQTADLFDGMRREHWIELDIYKEHCRIYAIELVIAIAILDPSTCIFSFISLYRKDPNHPFASEEKVLKQLLSQHLVGADRLNQQLGISPSTVTNHTNAIYRKLGITSKTQLTSIMDTS